MYSTYDNIVESLKLAWKYKYLWVVALLMLAGGSNFSNFSNVMTDEGIDSNNVPEIYDGIGSNPTTKQEDLERYNQLIQDLEKKQLENSAPQGTSPFGEMRDKVLGAASVLSDTTEMSDIVDTTESDLIPEGNILGVALAVGVPTLLVLIIFMIYVGLVVRGWAQAAMIGGTFEGSKEDGDVDLRTLGKYGRENLGQMIRFNIFVALLFIGAGIAFGISTGILIAVGGPIGMIIVVPLAIVLLLFYIRLGLTIPFASRHIILKKMDYKTAYKDGIKTMYGNFIKVLKLILGNCLVYAAFMAILVIVVGIIGVGLFGGMVESDSVTIKIVLGMMTVLLLIVFMVGMQVIMGYSATFTNFTWTKLYTFIEKLDFRGNNTESEEKSEENVGAEEAPDPRLPPKPRKRVKPQEQSEENLEPQAQGKVKDGK